MSVWTRIPQGSKALAQTQLRKFFGAFDWELHATVPIEPGIQAQRNLFHRNVFRSTPSPMHRGKHVVLVIFSALDKDAQASDQATKTKRSSRSSDIQTRDSREWLRDGKDPGELGTIDAEIEKRIQRRSKGRSISPPPPPPPPPLAPLPHPQHPSRDRDIRDEDFFMYKTPDLQLGEPSGSNSRELVSRRDMYSSRERSRSHGFLPDDTAIDGEGIHERPNVRGREIARIRGRSSTRTHDVSGPKTSAEQKALGDSRGMRVRLNIPDFGSEYERRLQFPRPLDLPANDFALQSGDEAARSTIEALDLALTLYTGGGVSGQEPSHVPDDEEVISHTSEHDSAEDTQACSVADPEPVPGNLMRNLTATAESEDGSDDRNHAESPIEPDARSPTQSILDGGDQNVSNDGNDGNIAAPRQHADAWETRES